MNSKENITGFVCFECLPSAKCINRVEGRMMILKTNQGVDYLIDPEKVDKCTILAGETIFDGRVYNRLKDEEN